MMVREMKFTAGDGIYSSMYCAAFFGGVGDTSMRYGYAAFAFGAGEAGGMALCS